MEQRANELFIYHYLKIKLFIKGIQKANVINIEREGMTGII